jgi:hypothetical protein
MSTNGPLAVRLNELQPADEAAAVTFAEDLSAALVQYIDNLKLASRNYIWVVEGAVQKPNAPKKATNRARNLNRGFRGVYLGQQTQNDPKKLIGRGIGRPPWWITVLMSRFLAEKGFPIFGSAHIESDVVISQLANQFNDCVVVGSDMDLLSLSFSIRGMVTPQNRHSGIYLAKSSILEHFQLGALEFFICFACSNSSNFVPFQNNVKFGNILEYYRENPDGVKNYDFSKWTGLDENECARVKAELTKLILERKAVVDPSMENPSYVSADIPTDPIWLKFCSEKAENGAFRRQKLYDRMTAVFNEKSLSSGKGRVQKIQPGQGKSFGVL